MVSEYGYFSDLQLETISSRDFGNAVDKALLEFKGCLKDNREGAQAFCAFGTLKAGKESPVRLGVGIYAPALAIWWAIWGSESLLVLRTEDLECSPAATIEAVFAHIGVTKTMPGRDLGSVVGRSNERPSSRKFSPPPPTLQALERFYAPFNANLAHLTGDSRFLWKDPPCAREKKQLAI